MTEEKVLMNATLCFLVRDDKILLARKVDKIGKGCWNGYGGGFEVGENAEQCVIRELKEESDVTTFSDSIEKVAIVNFHNTKSDGEIFVCRVYVYLVRKWIGEPKETEEMLTPTWFSIKNLPFDQMMLADKVWLPEVLIGKRIIAEAYYSPFQKELLGKVIFKQVDDFAIISQEYK